MLKWEANRREGERSEWKGGERQNERRICINTSCAFVGAISFNSFLAFHTNNGCVWASS